MSSVPNPRIAALFCDQLKRPNHDDGDDRGWA
jgi:hypothetical protein